MVIVDKAQLYTSKNAINIHGLFFSENIWVLQKPTKRKIHCKLHQMACKPGSVYLIRDGWPFIWDVCYQTPRATYPSDSAKTRYNATPIRSCSRWGLPCQNCCQFRGALLPHPFTLTWRKARRFTFCGTFPRVSPAGCYPASCFLGARTFLQ